MNYTSWINPFRRLPDRSHCLPNHVPIGFNKPIPIVPQSFQVLDINNLSCIRRDNVFNIEVEPNNEICVDVGIYFGKDIEVETNELISKFVEPQVGNKVAPLSKNKMSIRLTWDIPVFCNPRRLSIHERNEVEKITQDLLSRRIIRHSSLPYASPIVLVKKKNGELRMCVDYRAINKLTIRDNYPLPLIEDCIEYLDGKRCFSLLDLKNGFHQVQMEEKSIELTSFVTPNGQFEYLCMPFGLKNGPSVF